MITEDIPMDGNNTMVSNDIKPTEKFVGGGNGKIDGILGKKRKERKFDRSLFGLFSEKSDDVEG
jgi:hypothetical protein